MKRKYINIVIAIILVVILFVAVKILYNNLSENHSGDEADKQSDVSSEISAPDFSVYDMEGNKVSLSSFKGKPVVINFWATWCGYCVNEFPHFENAWKKYGDRVEFMIVDLADGAYETEAKAKAFIEKAGYTFPVYFDNDSDAAMKYSATSIPMTIFIDENGNFVYKRVGAMNEQMLFGYIDNLIGEK